MNADEDAAHVQDRSSHLCRTPDPLLHKEETGHVIASAMEVINILGHGLLEKPYENALCVEFKERGIPFQQQLHYPILYKGSTVGDYVPDLIAFDKVVVEIKTVERITDHELGQVLNYLRITRLPVGLIINFKRAKLDWKRVLLTEH